MKSESSDIKPLLDIKDVLLRLTYQTNYTENLMKVGQILVEYLSEKLEGVCALYLHDNPEDPFQLNAVSDQVLMSRFSQITFNSTDVQKNDNNHHLMILRDLPFFTKKFKPIENTLKDHAYIKLLFYEDQSIGILLMTTLRPISRNLEENFLVIIDECAKLLYQVRKHLNTNKMGKQYEHLFLVTEKFHSTKDEKEVLTGVLHSLKELYPASTIRLLFLDEEARNHDLESEASYAFMTGEIRQIQKNDSVDLFYVPLRGRQGIYGVLEVRVVKDSLYKNDIEYIQLLANTAGHALENARLYQQSQQLISDLRMINEASQHLNANSGFDQTADYLIEQLIKDFGSDEVAVLFSHTNSEWETISGSTAFFFKQASKEFIHLIREKILQTNDSIFRGDLWKEFHPEQIPYRSLIAIPMQHDQEIFGLVIMLHKSPYHFTFDNFKLANSLIQHSTLALINARLKEELEHMVITDQLTHLYSRHYLNTKIDESFNNNEGGALILIDIDNFKEINDTFGHPIGDKILKQVSDIIQNNIREMDIAARWGGEELAVYLPKGTLEVASKIAERLLNLVEEETSPKVTISCGISNWTVGEVKSDPEGLLDLADKALYTAKSRGKNCVYY